jgi:hypothetical protein
MSPAVSAAWRSPAPHAVAIASAVSSAALVSSSTPDPPDERARLRDRAAGRVAKLRAAAGPALSFRLHPAAMSANAAPLDGRRRIP